MKEQLVGLGFSKSLEMIYKDNALPADDKEEFVFEKRKGPVQKYKLDKAAVAYL